MEPGLSQRESGWPLMITCQHSREVQVHPGLTSWGILSRPSGTSLGEFIYPGLRPGLFLAVPSGLIAIYPTVDLFSMSAVANQSIEKKS